MSQAKERERARARASEREREREREKDRETEREELLRRYEGCIEGLLFESRTSSLRPHTLVA